MGSRDDGARHLLLIPFAPGIGDTVMMEPLIRAMRSQLPSWRLTVVAREHAADLIPPRGFEYVRSSCFVERAPAPLRPFHRFIPQWLIAMAAEPAMAMNLGPFERVLNLFWVWESRVPFHRWWTPGRFPRDGVRHTVDVLAEYLEDELGITIPEVERIPRLEPLPAALDWADAYLDAHGVLGMPLASLVTSSANSLKWWSVSKWAELNERLVRFGWRTLMVAPAGNHHAQQVNDGCATKPLWPRADLQQVAALLSQSDLVVGIDTGPLHMAAALGTPWVGLFGPTNPRVIGPYSYSAGRAVVARFPKPASCRDCWRAFKNREDICPTLDATGCTTLVSVDEVVETIRQLRPGMHIA